MLLRLYQILTFLGGPFINIYLSRRKAQGKEDLERFAERLGNASAPRPYGSLLWIHAASIGEALSVIPLIEKLSKRFPTLNFLLTTGTTTSASIIESKLPDRVLHQYVPIDRISAVNKFLRHWKPDVALWVESELWPNLVSRTAKYCKIILINGRISEESYNKWLKYKSFSQQIIGSFSLILPQSKYDAERLEKLGGNNVKYIGNIKYDAPPLTADSQKMGELVSATGHRKLWLAASTHAGEEELIADVHIHLKEVHPELMTIIAPRHPKRADEIMNMAKEKNLKAVKRSAKGVIDDDTDIYIADTIGELGIFYRLVSIVFIGGSLVKRGGQNPLEAARLDCSIIYGPNMDNFLEIKRELEDDNAAICVKNGKALEDILNELVVDMEKQAILSKNALEVVEKKNGIVGAFADEISPYIEQIPVIKNEKKTA